MIHLLRDTSSPTVGTALRESPCTAIAVAPTAKAVTVHRGDRARLTFLLTNRTSASVRSTITARVPSSLRASGKKTVTVKVLRVGKTRKLSFKLLVGRGAKTGTHRVKVTMKVGDRTVTRTVKIRVRR